MERFKFIQTSLSGVYIIEPKIIKDNRGYFVKTYSFSDYKKAGLGMSFVEENQSNSKKGVLRGLHYQKKYPQGKLVRVIKGEIFDVAVDIRKNSKTFGMWFGIILSDENKKQLYIPEGYAHGFLVTSDEAEISYKCTDFYHPEDNYGIIWNDNDINISWPIEEIQKIILSEKDKNWESLHAQFG